MIKHYSFDLWLTLIKSNPAFKEKRARLFWKEYNPKKMSLQEVADTIQKVDVACNYTNEIIGKNIDALEMYCMVLAELGNDLKSLTALHVNQIYDRTIALFLDNPPTMYDNNTIDTLWYLGQRGASFSILSNTGFIKGTALKKFIAKSSLSQIPFRFMLFSDEHGLSKPNPFFYGKMLRNLKYKYKNEILHVGDNPIADGRGAQEAGVPFFIINNLEVSPFTINSLLDETLFPA